MCSVFSRSPLPSFYPSRILLICKIFALFSQDTPQLGNFQISRVEEDYFFQNYVIKCRHDFFQNIAEFQRFRSYSYQGVQIIRYFNKPAEILRRCSRIFTGDNSFLRGNHFNVPSGSTQSAEQPDAHPADFVTPKKKSVVSACGV